MAQLKDTVVQGTLSATDALISTSVQTSILRAPSSSNSTTYGPGTNGQILRSNGTKVYWGTLAATDIPDVYIKKAGNNDGIMTGTLTLHGLKGTADIDYGTTLPTSPTTGQIFFQISDPWYELPPVGSSDNGKILTVVGGQWTAATKQTELPSVSSSDNGKVLSVVNGAWASSNSLGNLSSLTTTAKTSAVAAINEVKAGVNTNSDAIAKFQGNYIPSTDDLNDYYGTEHTGLYNVGGTAPTNCPDTWVQLMVIASSSGVTQLILHENYLRIRRRTGSPLAWTAWNQILLHNVGWTTLAKDGANSYAKYAVRGNLVTVTCYHKVSSASIASWSNYVFGSIPSSYRPADDQYVRCVTDRADDVGCAFIVGSNGNVYIAGRYTGATNSSDIIYASLSYAIT